MLNNPHIIEWLDQHFTNKDFPVIKEVKNYLQNLPSETPVTLNVLDHLILLFYPALKEWRVMEEEPSDTLKALPILINIILNSIIGLKQDGINLDLMTIYKMYWFRDIKINYLINDGSIDLEQLEQHTLHLTHEQDQLFYLINTSKGPQKIPLRSDKYDSIKAKIVPKEVWLRIRNFDESLSQLEAVELLLIYGLNRLLLDNNVLFLTPQEIDLLMIKIAKEQHFPLAIANNCAGEKYWTNIILSFHAIKLTPALIKIWEIYLEKGGVIEFVTMLITLNKAQKLTNLITILEREWKKEEQLFYEAGYSAYGYDNEIFWMRGEMIFDTYWQLYLDELLSTENEKLLPNIYDLSVDLSNGPFHRHDNYISNRYKVSEELGFTLAYFSWLEKNQVLTASDKCAFKAYNDQDIARSVRYLYDLNKTGMLEFFSSWDCCKTNSSKKLATKEVNKPFKVSMNLASYFYAKDTTDAINEQKTTTSLSTDTSTIHHASDAQSSKAGMS